MFCGTAAEIPNLRMQDTSSYIKICAFSEKAFAEMKNRNVNMRELQLKEGLRDGIPIALGYLSVSFGFGIMATSLGLPVWVTVLISMTCLTSAGQVAGVTVIAAAGGCLELAMTQLIINMRYALMSLSLSQKLDAGFRMPGRLAVSYGITDEIFAVASAKEGEISRKYMAGLIALPWVGWSLGTFLGAFAGNVLPAPLKAGLCLAIYGMFIAIVVPPARKSTGVLVVAVIAVALSCIFHYLPGLRNISDGFVIIICGLIASLAGAACFPIREDTEREELQKSQAQTEPMGDAAFRTKAEPLSDTTPQADMTENIPGDRGNGND